MFGVKSLLWLLSAVNEVKTTRGEQKSGGENTERGRGGKKEKRGGKKIVGRGAGHTVLQLYLIKSAAAAAALI